MYFGGTGAGAGLTDGTGAGTGERIRLIVLLICVLLLTFFPPDVFHGLRGSDSVGTSPARDGNVPRTTSLLPRAATTDNRTGCM